MEEEQKQGLLNAYRRLLRPLIRILIRNGVAYGAFAEVAKEVYVDVASRDFKVPHRKMSQARIAIVTGLTRKEVARLMSDDKNSKEELKSDHNRVTRVLTGWHTDADYTGPYGLPLELKFEEDKEQPNFSELVHRYSGDMAARAMLDELMRIGAVIETESGWYKVLTRTYTPAIHEPASLERLSSVIYNFINTVDQNIFEKDTTKRNFERYVFADNGIRPEDLPRFRSFIKERAQLLLEEIDNWLSQLEEPDDKRGKAVRTGLGIYHYVDTDEENKE
jgi:predicted XRE-type DNA-binding protein